MYELIEQPVIFERDDHPDKIIVFFPSRPFWFAATPQYRPLLKAIHRANSIDEMARRLSSYWLSQSNKPEYILSVVHEAVDFLGNAGVLKQNGKLIRKYDDLEPKQQITEVESVLVYEVTRRCNLFCPHCYASAGGKQDKASELSVAEFCKILDELQKLPWAPELSNIGLIGGEPFVRRDLFEIIECIRERDYGVLISTNGLLITREHIKKLSMYERLQVSVSLDGSVPETHEFIRGPHTFSRTVNTIRALVENGIDVGINVFVHRGNLNDLPNILQLALELGVSSLNANTLMLIGRGLTSSIVQPVRRVELYQVLYEQARSDSRIERLIENSTFANKIVSIASGIKTKYCGVGSQRAVYVRSDGTLYPCGNTCVPYFYLGNLRRESIADIWVNSPKLKDLRKTDIDLLNSQCSSCIFRYYCGGDCRGETYQTTGNFTAPHPKCDEIKESIEAMMWMLADTPHLFQAKIRRTQSRIIQASQRL